jgi:hypothetical protein
MGTVDNVGRYSIFTQFTDEQLREMAEWGNQKYFMGND